MLQHSSCFEKEVWGWEKKRYKKETKERQKNIQKEKKKDIKMWEK